MLKCFTEVSFVSARVSCRLHPTVRCRELETRYFEPQLKLSLSFLSKLETRLLGFCRLYQCALITEARLDARPSSRVERSNCLSKIMKSVELTR